MKGNQVKQKRKPSEKEDKTLSKRKEKPSEKKRKLPEKKNW